MDAACTEISVEPALATDLLMQALAECLENMAFITPDPFEADRIADTATLVRTVIRFTGPLAGTIEVICPRELGDNLAVTIFCMDPLDEAIILRSQDAMHELCNVVAGQYLRGLSQRLKCRFDMGLPSLRPLDAEENPSELMVDPGSVAVLAEGHPVLVRVRFQRETAGAK